MRSNILNLPSFQVVELLGNEHDYHVKAGASHSPTFCIHYGYGKLEGLGRHAA
jgi:hypothetical protein